MTAQREIISIRKVRKDGSIDRNVVDGLVRRIKNGEMVAMPVDSVFGLIGIAREMTEEDIGRNCGENREDFVRIISSYRMLDQIASVGKSDSDFLHRIWPGEVTVRLKIKIPKRDNQSIPVRFSRNRFVQDIISKVDHPLVFTSSLRFRRQRRFRIDDIYNKYKMATAILLIEEFCKKHPYPTIINITGGELAIENEGKIAADEIKSLYFL
jgi:tRNA A37 threonylcarbamoyladenosine synthetase subunit TsaC/SUA5/YrdC